MNLTDKEIEALQYLRQYSYILKSLCDVEEIEIFESLAKLDLIWKGKTSYGKVSYKVSPEGREILECLKTT